MNTAVHMQKIITELAAKHGLDLTARESALKLHREVYMPLVIEKIGSNLVSVAHYYTQNGDAIADPDMEFFTGYNEWVPIAITQAYGGYQRAAEFNSDCTKIVRYAPKLVRSLAAFANQWAQNIRAQGWLDAEVVYVQNPNPTPKPTLRTADLTTRQEYALYVGDEPETPALPASKFQLQQAVRTAFWGRYAGRIVSISHNGAHYFYEVQLDSGRVVLEPETHLTAAPELDTVLPSCDVRPALSAREIEARMDTPDYDAGSSSGYCQWNGIDQLNPEVR